MLSVRGLSCVRDGRVLFEDLHLAIASGEVVALQGANGAGKSTLLRCIAGLYPDYEGELRVPGFVYAGHKAGLCGYLSAAENLSFLGALDDAALADAEDMADADDIADAEDVEHAARDALSAGATPYLAKALASNVSQALERVGLPGYEDVRCNSLSAGQLRRVGLARLLRTRAPLWLLDEPLTALDAAGADLLGELLAAHIAAGGAALCATHQPLPVLNQRSFILEGSAHSEPFDQRTHESSRGD